MKILFMVLLIGAIVAMAGPGGPSAMRAKTLRGRARPIIGMRAAS